MRSTLHQLVRDQILADGPPIGGILRRLEYANTQLNAMTNVELLERISDALDAYNRDLSVRLGL